VLKFKKNNSGAKRLIEVLEDDIFWIPYFQDCKYKWVIERKIKWGMAVRGRRRRRRRKLLDDLKGRRGYSHLKEEDLDRTVWRAGFGRGFGPVVKTDY